MTEIPLAAPGQMPQMDGPGPAPVPYAGGRDQYPAALPAYEAAPLDMAPADGYVLHGVTGLNTTRDPSAYDVNGNPGPSPLSAPYYPGTPQPIHAHGDNDPGGRSPLGATVAEAVANATARWQNLESDTRHPGPQIGTVVQNQPNLSGPGHPQQQGAAIGDPIHFPASPLDPGVGVGNTMPTGAFFDPTREYGGSQGAPGYQGEAV